MPGKGGRGPGGAEPGEIPAGGDPRGGITLPHLVLVGLPGSGKTTVGQHIAATFGRQFIDFDAEIERQFGKSVSKIFSEEGEPVFRAAEVELSRTLAATRGSILAPGGGWAANVPAVAHLRPVSRIIYLRVSPEGALARLRDAIDQRPLLATGDPAATMRTLYEARRRYYEEIADQVVETDPLDRHALLTTVAALVAETWG